MFTKNSRIARITLGYVVASLMFFATAMPASAADMQFKKDIGTEVSIDEEVQEDFLNPERPELSDEAAAPVTGTDNGGTVLVMPRSHLDEPVNTDSNDVVEDVVTVEDEAADENVEVECYPGEDEEDEDDEEVDKSKLEAAIEAAGELDEADYTQESWSKLERALAIGERVMEDDKATQGNVDRALVRLNKAMDALEEVEDDEEEEENIQIGIYKELLEAFEKMQGTYNKLLDMFTGIFGN